MSSKVNKMKLSPKTTELLFELRHLESLENMQILVGDLDQLSSKLLRLYRTTDNAESHAVIAELLSEAGYPWFRHFAERSVKSTKQSVSKPMCYQMNQDQFLDLIPANCHFH